MTLHGGKTDQDEARSSYRSEELRITEISVLLETETGTIFFPLPATLTQLSRPLGYM